MKKFLIVGMTVIIMAFMFSGCNRNNASTAVVPNNVLDKFYDSYPTADEVNWKMQDNTFEADFEIAGKDMKARYTPYID